MERECKPELTPEREPEYPRSESNSAQAPNVNTSAHPSLIQGRNESPFPPSSVSASASTMMSDGGRGLSLPRTSMARVPVDGPHKPAPSGAFVVCSGAVGALDSTMASLSPRRLPRRLCFRRIILDLDLDIDLDFDLDGRG